MTRRDLRWRGLGAAFLVGGSGCVLLVPEDAGGLYDLLAMACMALTFFGIVLLVQGKKVPLALRIENSPHRMLPALIRRRRSERRIKRQP